jgi:histidyl-tRNA synthetase
MGQYDITLSLDPDTLLRRTHAIASFYGFTYLPDFLESRKDKRERAVYPDGVDPKTMDPIATPFAQFLRQMKEYQVDPEIRPRFLWHSNAVPGRKAPKQMTVHFHILGVQRAIADALMIRTLRALVHDLTKEMPTVRINSLGDDETGVRYGKELGNYLRRNIADLTPQCQAYARQDPLEALEHLLRYEDAIGHRAPSPLDYLSESSRTQLQDVLEYLESTKTKYDLAPHLIDRRGNLGEVCFELSTKEGSIARGGRYSSLAQKFFTEGGHATGGVLRANALVESTCKALPKKRGKTPVVFVQLGPEAKRLSLSLLEELRAAHISLEQTVGIESMIEQMDVADSFDAPYLMIMGQKEALSKTVILRDRRTNSQTIVPIAELIKVLQKLA